MTNRLIIMAKKPSAGRVKTRLARDIGTVQALRFYRHRLATTCRTLAGHPGWRTILCVTPDTLAKPLNLQADEMIGQGSGGLGARMQRLFDDCGLGPLIIIGADIPGITPEMIARAFHLLKGHDFVFGPADDGGYWLVGQRRTPKVVEAFKNVRWSGPYALADTLDNLAGCSIGFVDQLTDIDRGADLVSSRENGG
jgi:rSAM/selenodomain-associated transferase 1